MIDGLERKFSTLNKIRSFVIRSGRITSAQQRALDCLLPEYGNKTEITELIKYAERTKKAIHLEVGLGNGENLIYMAKRKPEDIFLGCDVHLPGIGFLLNSLKSEQVENVRVLVGDVRELLINFEAVFQNIYIFFPDPWPKKRHEKRRLVDEKFLNFVSEKIKNNGKVFIATDSKSYATSILKALESAKFLSNIVGPQQCSERPLWRALTRFERKALKRHSKIYEICGINKIT